MNRRNLETAVNPLRMDPCQRVYLLRTTFWDYHRDVPWPLALRPQNGATWTPPRSLCTTRTRSLNWTVSNSLWQFDKWQIRNSLTPRYLEKNVRLNNKPIFFWHLFLLFQICLLHSYEKLQDQRTDKFDHYIRDFLPFRDSYRDALWCLINGVRVGYKRLLDFYNWFTSAIRKSFYYFESLYKAIMIA